MIETIKNTWNETMEIPEARWIFWLTILVIAVTVAIYFAKMFRDMATGRNVATCGKSRFINKFINDRSAFSRI